MYKAREGEKPYSAERRARQRENNRRWYGRHREELLAYRKAYYRANHAAMRVAHRRYRRVAQLKVYGLTEETYQQLFQSQRGRCAICQQKERAKSHGKVCRLAVDHCHATRRVRGLLCSRCNPLLGYARDDVNLLRRAAAYLERAEETRCRSRVTT